MKNCGSNRWEEITAVMQCETAPLGDGVPFGMATRVVAQWRQSRRDEALRRWSFWSLRAALCSVTVCALVAILASNHNDSSILIQPPSAEFIELPLSNR
jgi:hypothetical protein